MKKVPLILKISPWYSLLLSFYFLRFLEVPCNCTKEKFMFQKVQVHVIQLICQVLVSSHVEAFTNSWDVKQVRRNLDQAKAVIEALIKVYLHHNNFMSSKILKNWKNCKIVLWVFRKGDFSSFHREKRKSGRQWIVRSIFNAFKWHIRSVSNIVFIHSPTIYFLDCASTCHWKKYL